MMPNLKGDSRSVSQDSISRLLWYHRKVEESTLIRTLNHTTWAWFLISTTYHWRDSLNALEAHSRTVICRIHYSGFLPEGTQRKRTAQRGTIITWHKFIPFQCPWMMRHMLIGRHYLEIFAEGNDFKIPGQFLWMGGKDGYFTSLSFPKDTMRETEQNTC